MKVYIITIDDVFDFEGFSHEPKVFDSMEKAKAAFSDLCDEVIAENEENGNDDWEVERTSTYFSTYPDGYWGTSHYDMRINEVEVQ